jgi:hypothetical protein
LSLCEYALAEIFQSILETEQPTPILDNLRLNFAGFRESEVQRRRNLAADAILAEYQAAYVQTIPLASQIPADLYHRLGVLPWYGADFDLDDFIVYTFYGHKRERAGQIATFRDRLKGLRQPTQEPYSGQVYQPILL